jgi:hypothetical protein
MRSWDKQLLARDGTLTDMMFRTSELNKTTSNAEKGRRMSEVVPDLNANLEAKYVPSTT